MYGASGMFDWFIFCKWVIPLSVLNEKKCTGITKLPIRDPIQKTHQSGVGLYTLQQRKRLWIKSAYITNHFCPFHSSSINERNKRAFRCSLMFDLMVSGLWFRVLPKSSVILTLVNGSFWIACLLGSRRFHAMVSLICVR